MKFQLADGYNSASTFAFGHDEPIVLAPGDVYETDDANVIAALQLAPGIVEVVDDGAPAKTNDGDVPPVGGDDAPANDGAPADDHKDGSK